MIDGFTTNLLDIVCHLYAAGGSDFTAPMPLTLTLISTDTTVCGNISTVNDNILELDKVFTVALDSSDPAEGEGVVFGTPSSVNATINDDEGMYMRCLYLEYSVVLVVWVTQVAAIFLCYSSFPSGCRV